MRMPNSRQISDEQEEIYAEAPIDGTVLIVGPPGTGKTVIAFLRAQILNKKNKSAHVLMYSNVLQRYTNNIASSEENAVKSGTLIKWISKWWKAHSIQTPSNTTDKVYLVCSYDEKDQAKAAGAKWDSIKKKWYVNTEKYQKSAADFSRWLPGGGLQGATDTEVPKITDYKYDWEAMLVAAAKHSQMQDWGHLIIDEAQDFPVEMFSFLRFVAQKVDNGGLTLLADENQRLTEENSTIEQIKRALAIKDDRYFVLEQNFRNTVQIAKLANHFYVGLASGLPKLPKRQGPIPELVKAATLDDQIAYIVRILKARAPGEVGVFVQRDTMRKKVFNKLQHHLGELYRVQSYSSKDKENHPVDDLVFDTSGTLTVLNRQSCKGLEFDVVFIPELQTIDLDGSSLDAFKMNMYVMCSRARETLYLLYSSTTSTELPVIQHLPAKETGLLEYKNV